MERAVIPQRILAGRAPELSNGAVHSSSSGKWAAVAWLILFIAPLGRAEAAAPATMDAAGPPVIPVGLDAYRQWERWPFQRLGVRAYMRSTYDRTGGNESADASHYLYQES